MFWWCLGLYCVFAYVVMIAAVRSYRAKREPIKTGIIIVLAPFTLLLSLVVIGLEELGKAATK